MLRPQPSGDLATCHLQIIAEERTRRTINTQHSSFLGFPNEFLKCWNCILKWRVSPIWDQVMCNCCGWTLLYAALAGRRNVKICWMNEWRMNEWMDGWLEERSLNFSVFTTALQSVTVGVMIARNRQCSYSIHSPRTIHPTCWKHQGTRQLSRERCTLRGVINALCGQMPNACIPSVSKHLLNDFATPGPKLRAGVEQRKTSPNLPAFMELTL